MEFIYNYNGLPFYNESEISLRNYFINCLKIGIDKILKNKIMLGLLCSVNHLL